MIHNFVCVCVWFKCFLLEHFVPSWWHCLGSFKRCGLAERSVSVPGRSESLKLITSG